MDLPYLTRDLEGTGGALRRDPEDFRVDEIPLYEPSGEGQHVYFKLWKRGIDTFEAVRRVARALGKPEHAFAYAGLKDSRAVTTQWMSTEAATPEEIEALEIPKAAILEVRRHRNKLRVGHLRGNRFHIIVRNAVPENAPAILAVLRDRGVPNFFGSQRFGSRLNGHLCGEALVRRDYEAFIKVLLGGPSRREKSPYLTEARRLFDEGKLEEAYESMPVDRRVEKKALHALIRFQDHERAYFAIPRRMRQMFLSAFQSHLFNRVLTTRLQECDTVQPGDLALLHRNRAVFEVTQESLETERERCRSFEISPSGPLFGTEMIRATGRPGEIEQAVLDEARVRPEDFDVGGGLSAKGRRRALRIPLQEVALEQTDEATYSLAYSLPPGCYATTVMRELMKVG